MASDDSRGKVEVRNITKQFDIENSDQGLAIRDINFTVQPNEFMTIVGPVAFTGSENLKTPSKILQWQKGEIEIVWPLSDATAEIQYPKPPWPGK